MNGESTTYKTFTGRNGLQVVDSSSGEIYLRQTPCPATSVPSMGRILLDERSQSEPMTATVVNREA